MTVVFDNAQETCSLGSSHLPRKCSPLGPLVGGRVAEFSSGKSRDTLASQRFGLQPSLPSRQTLTFSAYELTIQIFLLP